MCEAAGITTNTLAKMGKNESIQVEVLGKICVSLGCKLDDIVAFDGKCEKYIPVPNIDLTEIDAWDEYETLGYKQLYDFPHPVSRKSIQSHLVDCLESCKLTQAACNELLGKLKEKGVGIKLPQNIVPNCALLPQKFSNSEDRNDLEHTQIQNYLSWAIYKKLSDGVDLASIEVVHQGGQFLIERGFACVDSTKEGYRFEAVEQTATNAESIYPLNLLLSVFDEGRCNIFECRLADLKEQVNQVFETLTEKEKLVLNLIYQKGYTSERICSVFNLPSFETITDGIAYIHYRALRKLRHPSRSRKFNDLVFEDCPAKRLNKCAVYQDYIEALKKTVRESISNGRTLQETLQPYYRSDVIKRIIEAAPKWQQIPDISIDDMVLSWKTHHALQKCHITKFEQLRKIYWNPAGITTLKKVLGITNTEVDEILQQLSKYRSGPIKESCASEIVNFAEIIAADGETSPTVVSSAMPNTALNWLLSHKYRNISDVIADYRQGILIKLLAESDGDEIVNSILATVTAYDENKHAMFHIICKTWCSEFLKTNNKLTMQDVRNIYLLDKPLKGNIEDIDKKIWCFFPGHPIEFTLMNGTRSGKMTWIAWTNESIAEKLLETDEAHGDYAVYWGVKNEDIQKDEAERYLLLTPDFKNKESVSYHLFSFNGKRLEIIRDIPQEYLKSLAMIVSVTASENISSHVPRAEILSLFSRFFGDQEKIEAAQLMFSPNSAEQPYLDGGDLGALQGIELFELPPELKTIEELDFSQRTYNILTHAEISTLGELENYSFQSLMEIPKMGKKSLEEIMAKLQEYRIIFKKSL